jgi:hypothetical protein
LLRSSPSRPTGRMRATVPASNGRLGKCEQLDPVAVRIGDLDSDEGAVVLPIQLWDVVCAQGGGAFSDSIRLPDRCRAG